MFDVLQRIEQTQIDMLDFCVQNSQYSYVDLLNMHEIRVFQILFKTEQRIEAQNKSLEKK
jgi:hypothetical protein